MINSVKVINYTGDELVMELRNPEKSGFLVYNMTGIGPEKAEIRTTDIVTSDGGFYNSSRLPSRNIVLGLIFASWSGKTVEEIRHESYRYFPIKKPLTLVIEGDERISEITGYVESNEPVIFTSQVYTQLSIICPYPFFYDGGPNGLDITIFSGIDPVFEFPFSNESVPAVSALPRNLFVLNQYQAQKSAGTLSYEIDFPDIVITSSGVNNDVYIGSNESYSTDTRYAITPGETYTISIESVVASNPGNVNTMYMQPLFFNNDVFVSLGPKTNIANSKTNGFIYVTANRVGVRFGWTQLSAAINETLTISKIKLEAGGSATAWLPAPEDTTVIEDVETELLIMGEIKNRSEEIVTYSGDSEIGITIIMDAIGPVENVIIHNVLTRERMTIDTNILKTITGSSIVAGDRIIISTVTGTKSIRLLRNGVYTNILNVLGKNISWFQLSKGDNVFAFEAEYGQENLFFRIENRIIYEGV